MHVILVDPDNTIYLSKTSESLMVSAATSRGPVVYHREEYALTFQRLLTIYIYVYIYIQSRVHKIHSCYRFAYLCSYQKTEPLSP